MTSCPGTSKTKKWKTMVRLALRSALETLCGFILGLVLISLFKSSTVTQHVIEQTRLHKSNKQYNANHGNSLVFIGVMTARKFLDSRAVALYETWGKNIEGSIKFFTSEHSRTNASFELVSLPGVDDVYPPQKKSFMMLKYMYENHLNEYEWFMRVDDDVYIKTDLLQDFLRSVNSDRYLFVGQAGTGTGTGKRENLRLGPDENYCMGGPGMVISRRTLQKIGPYLEQCLQNLYTTHEDVEIGRCIHKYAGISCTWSYEMKFLFHHNGSAEKAYTGTLRQSNILEAITLHPLKDLSRMYRMHSFLTTVQLKDLNYKMLMLQRKINTLKTHIDPGNRDHIINLKPSLSSYTPNEPEDLISWKMFDRTMYDDGTENPHYRMFNYYHQGVYDNIRDLLMHVKRYNQERGRIIVFKKLLYGYLRVNPLHGVQYVMDVLLTYQRYIGKKMTLPVRRHAYVQQALLQPEVRLVPDHHSDTKLSIILPLAGRLETLKRFLRNYETVCLKPALKVDLSIILFIEQPDESYVTDVSNLVDEINQAHLFNIKVHKLYRQFSRGYALNYGAARHPPETLLVFLDVDMVFDKSFIHRAALNTVRGSSVYFPIVYSQYDPGNVPIEKQTSSHYNFDSDVGYWRKYGFGIAAIFKSDFEQFARFNENIVGWGLEDVDFVEKIMKSHLKIFRSSDPGIVHIYHEPSCQTGASQIQHKMCLGTKLTSTGSVKTLVDKLDSVL